CAGAPWSQEETDALSPLIEEDAIAAYREAFPLSDRTDKALKVRHERIHHGKGPRFRSTDPISEIEESLPESPVSARKIPSASTIYRDELEVLLSSGGSMSGTIRLYRASFPNSERSDKAIWTMYRRISSGGINISDYLYYTDANQSEKSFKPDIPKPSFDKIEEDVIVSGSKWDLKELSLLARIDPLKDAIAAYRKVFPNSERTRKSLHLQYFRLRKDVPSVPSKPLESPNNAEDLVPKEDEIDVVPVPAPAPTIVDIEPKPLPDTIGSVDDIDETPVQINHKDSWLSEELAVIAVASSRQDAINRYREAFPQSGRNDKSVGTNFYRLKKKRAETKFVLEKPETDSTPFVSHTSSAICDDAIPYIKEIPDSVFSKILVSKSLNDARSSCKYYLHESGIDESIIDKIYTYTKDVVKLGKEVSTVLGIGKIVNIDRQICRCLVDCKNAGKIWTNPLKIYYGYMYGVENEAE
ncbi:hypothetical protein KO465_04600, partial [Candidatus Micrarchaeota archaeon]|nr:hypothetical protein [Candidatus Micrarchaeota archaeon]